MRIFLRPQSPAAHVIAHVTVLKVRCAVVQLTAALGKATSSDLVIEFGPQCGRFRLLPCRLRHARSRRFNVRSFPRLKPASTPRIYYLAPYDPSPDGPPNSLPEIARIRHRKIGSDQEEMLWTGAILVP